MTSSDDIKTQHDIVPPAPEPEKTDEDKDDDKLEGAEVVDVDDSHKETFGDTDNDTISNAIDKDEEAIATEALDEELEDQNPQKPR